jgi:hypothetical protein
VGSDSTGYVLAEPKLSQSKDTATFVVEFEAEGKKAPHTVKATKDQAIEQWFIAGFDQ